MNLPLLTRYCCWTNSKPPVQVRADEGEHQAAVGAVVLQHAGAATGRSWCRAGSRWRCSRTCPVMTASAFILRARRPGT